MKLSDISIRRPVLALVFSLVIILFGILAYSRLPVREYPDIDPPIVSVTTFYRGASPSVVETEITDVLEEQLSTIEGIKTMTSSSQEQGSVITIEFELGRNVDEAANDVRDRVSRIRDQLPREADAPIVEKVDVNAQAVVWLALHSPDYSNLEVSDVAERILKDRLQHLPGVGTVILGGERRYAMRVWLDPQRMAAHGLTTSDIDAALLRENTEIPAGRVEGAEREFSVRTLGDLDTPQEFSNIIVKQEGDNFVRLGDVADVELGAEDNRTAVRFNGEPAIGLGIVKQTKASTIEVADAVVNDLPELTKLLPEGMHLDVAYNSATFIKESINEVGQTLALAVLLVVLVILLFLKSFRATLIPAFAIPTSILGAFAVAYFLGFTINILTLLALVLAIGLVVDDAIVMLENVYRHMEMGKTRWRAALDGSKEIGFAIMATTISLVAVFVPLAFLQGNVGRLFNEFGITVAVAVLISGFVALTLTPMLCSRLLKPLHGQSDNWASRSFDRFFTRLDGTYRRTLDLVLHHRIIAMVGALVLVAVIAVMMRLLPRELVPVEDRGTAFGVVMAPEGSTLQYTDKYMRQIEAILMKLPERRALFTATGLGFGGPGRVTDGFLFLGLKPRSERHRSQQQIVQAMFPRLLAIPGVLAFLINPPSLGQDFSSPVQYVLEADTYAELQKAVGIMMGKASKLGYLINLNTDLHLDKPQLDLAIDRARAAELGVSVEDIGSALETYLGGRVVGNFKRGSKQYDVITELRPSDRSTPASIYDLYVRGKGGLVQLANVVHEEETVAPKELNHFNRIRSATISANIVPGVSLGQALDALDKIAATDLPAGIKTDLTGESLEFRESSSALYFLFLFAVVFIFLVLAAQFESFVHPLTILLSVPLAVVGALVSLFVFKQTINIYSQIGLIMLIGLVTKNSILIVEYANQLRRQGRDVFDAVANASAIRLRPILMTSFATIFGVMPIALGIGAGGESRQPLGIAVVGGMLFSTFLTLLLVPVVYTLLARITHAESVTEREEMQAGAISQPAVPGADGVHPAHGTR
jgi:multidrug efflux pump